MDRSRTLKSLSPPCILLPLLLFQLFFGLSWSRSLQQPQEPAVEGITYNDVNTPSHKAAEISTTSSHEILPLDRGQAVESRTVETKLRPQFVETEDAKESIHSENDNHVDDQKLQESQNEKENVGDDMIILPSVRLPVLSVGSDQQQLDVQLGEEHIARLMDEAIEGLDAARNPSIEIYVRKPFINGVDIRQDKPIFSKILDALSKPWQYWSKGGILAILEHHFTRARIQLTHWLSSLHHKKAPMTWGNTEPLALAEPVAPVMAYTRGTLKGRMLFAIKQAMLQYRSSATIHGSSSSCVGKIEEGATMLREALSSQLKRIVCHEFASSDEKEFCEFLQSHPKIASLMVFSKFDVNPVVVALSHSVDAGICTSSSDVSQLGDTIHHVMKLGHHIHGILSSKDLLKKRPPTAMGFWKSLFARQRNGCEACFHQVIENVKKVIKQQLIRDCKTAKCPKIVSACTFAKKYKRLAKMLLMLKLQPWHYAARSCAGQNSCFSLPSVVSGSEAHHKINGMMFHRFDRAHVVERGAQLHNADFPISRGRACRKAMLFRKNPVGLLPFNPLANLQIPVHMMDLHPHHPAQMGNVVPESHVDDFHAIMSMIDKLHLNLFDLRTESNGHGFNIQVNLRSMPHGHGVKGSLHMKEISPAEVYRILHHQSRMSHEEEHPLRGVLPLSEAEREVEKKEQPSRGALLLPEIEKQEHPSWGELLLPEPEHKVEKQEENPTIQTVSTNKALSRAEM